ncbi:MAG: DnaJ domain-containing protein [Methylococcales bacterium]
MDIKKDYYSVLGVILSADLIVIKAAYKALVQPYHPDRYSGYKEKEEANQRISEITKAYRIRAIVKSGVWNLKRLPVFDLQFA